LVPEAKAQVELAALTPSLAPYDTLLAREVTYVG